MIVRLARSLRRRRELRRLRARYQGAQNFKPVPERLVDVINNGRTR